MANSDNGRTTGFVASEHAHEADSARHLDEAILRTMRQPLLVLSEDLRVERANRAFYRTFSVDEEETDGQLLYGTRKGNGDIPQLRVLAFEETQSGNGTVDDLRSRARFRSNRYRRVDCF